ncbi:MAG TPA: ABC transporter permease subunit [Anaerolineaceae bacterium]|nr:ABC transporter permease subunit [Anaerolineaceae bacterium]
MRLFNSERKQGKLFTGGDLIVLLAIITFLYVGIRLAFDAPTVVKARNISLSPAALPWYTALSVGRMAAAYALSMIFTLLYGRLAAYNRRAEHILMPLLDVLQSVPILSFLPVVLLGLSAVLPEGFAAELASIVLIFTSQVWNLTFAWYQSLTTIPKELQEASAIFRLNTWFRFKTMELPFAAISLVWNSMMSWAGGWFFLMAAEIFTVGQRDFRLPGLGAYLHEAANQENFRAIAWGVGALVLTVVLLDQLVWRPLMAWTERFKIEMVENDNPPTSWFFELLHNSRFSRWFTGALLNPLISRLDRRMLRIAPPGPVSRPGGNDRIWVNRIVALVGLVVLLYGVVQAVLLLITVPAGEWARVALGVGATLARVIIALLLALAWTIPVGVSIGTNPRLANILQPIVQVTASVPATAIFPVFVLLLVGLPGGLNLAAVLLMLMGTQWYLLFNIIAGASSIPQDLKYTAKLIHLNGWERWRTLILPALFPFLVTGMITASGGAWNASIVSEYVTFGGQILHTTGIGSLIAQATAEGNYPLLLAATLSMIAAVILINRLFWRRLYQLAEERYRME